MAAQQPDNIALSELEHQRLRGARITAVRLQLMFGLAAILASGWRIGGESETTPAEQEPNYFDMESVLLAITLQRTLRLLMQSLSPVILQTLGKHDYFANRFRRASFNLLVHRDVSRFWNPNSEGGRHGWPDINAERHFWGLEVPDEEKNTRSLLITMMRLRTLRTIVDLVQYDAGWETPAPSPDAEDANAPGGGEVSGPQDPTIGPKDADTSHEDADMDLDNADPPSAIDFSDCLTDDQVTELTEAFAELEEWGQGIMDLNTPLVSEYDEFAEAMGQPSFEKIIESAVKTVVDADVEFAGQCEVWRADEE